MPAAEIEDRYELAKKIAKLAGQSTLELFQNKELQVERKGDQSPVTIADRNAEQLLRGWIQDAFPSDSIIGEEFGSIEGSSGYRWILDPIDGTKSFINGVPLYGTMVGVEFQSRSIIGAVYIPGLDEGIYAATDQGAWHIKGDEDPVRAQVSQTESLADCTFVTSEVKTFAERGAADAFLKLQESCYVTRTWGDCYGYLLVATGRVDVMVDPKLNVWDAAAVQPIIVEAGGRFTDWKGLEKIDSGDAIGSNGRLHEQLLAITGGY